MSKLTCTGMAAGSGQVPGAVAGSSPLLCVVPQSLLALRLCTETVTGV